MIVMMDEISNEGSGGIGKGDARGFALYHDALLQGHILDLLTKHHALDGDLLEVHPTAIKNPHT